MEFKFVFDEKNPMYVPTDDEYNLRFLRCTETHLNDSLMCRGYLYLNEIYNTLYIRWNPEWVNTCIIYEPKKRIRLEHTRSDKGYEITVRYS